MNKYAHALERLVNALIPFVLVALGVVLVFTFTTDLEPYEKFLAYFDGFVVTVLVMDLIFKWYHTKKVLKFLKLYWLDILAVFPFYLVFRVYAEATDLFRFARSLEETQQIAHEVLLIQEEAKVAEESRLLREVKEASMISKESRAVRLIRFFQRSLRLLKARWILFHKHMVHRAKTLKKKSNT